MNMNKSSAKSVKKIAIWAVVVACILSIPLLGNAPWTLGDYIFAGSVLFAAGVVYELLARNMKNNLQRIVIGAIILFLLLLIWGWAVA
jgi:hypothetical protein